MTIFVIWQLIVTLDSIRNSCDVLDNRRALWVRMLKSQNFEERNTKIIFGKYERGWRPNIKVPSSERQEVKFIWKWPIRRQGSKTQWVNAVWGAVTWRQPGGLSGERYCHRITLLSWCFTDQVLSFLCDHHPHCTDWCHHQDRLWPFRWQGKSSQIWSWYPTCLRCYWFWCWYCWYWHRILTLWMFIW